MSILESMHHHCSHASVLRLQSALHSRLVMGTFAVLLLSLFGIATLQARSFPDVNSLDGGASAIDSLSDKGIIQGFPDGTFRPTQFVNRAEFFTMLLRAVPTTTAVTDFHCFADFRGTEQWFWRSACEGKALGILQGHPNGTFRGTDPVNLAEAITMSVRIWNLPLPQYFREPDNWYDPYMDAAASINIFDFIDQQTSRRLTREEVAIVINTFITELSHNECSGRELGETFPSSDGCNTCTCTENGPACTKKACPSGERCTSSNDCPANQRCSTERGDCQSACPPGNDMCIQVCTGVCELKTTN